MSTIRTRGIITSAFVALFTLPFVSAATNYELFAQWITSGFETVKFNPAVLTTILLGILLWTVLYSIVNQVFQYKGRAAIWSGGLISLIIVILTFMYVPENFMEAIALQYSAVGATILTLIPFVILLYFTIVTSRSLLIARAIWIFYTIYYVTIFLYKTATSSSGFWSWSNLPYFGAILAGLVVLFGIKTMRTLIFSGKLDAEEEQALRGVKIRQTLDKVKDEEAAGKGIK